MSWPYCSSLISFSSILLLINYAHQSLPPLFSFLDPLTSLLSLKCTKHGFISGKFYLFFPWPKRWFPNICHLPYYFQVILFKRPSWPLYMAQQCAHSLHTLVLSLPLFLSSYLLSSNMSYILIVGLFILECKQEMYVLNTAITKCLKFTQHMTGIQKILVT